MIPARPFLAGIAVFAALGLLVADALHPAYNDASSRWKRHSPLIAGVVLLSLLGVGGPRTDVNAHLTGFLAGAILGWFSCRLPHRILANGWIQGAAGGSTVAILALAWRFALRAGP